MNKVSKYQTHKIVRMHRSDLKAAEYNPRRISDRNKRKLKSRLKKHGMVNVVTFNRKTGNIVGGHQRLEALDALEGTNDYYLDVAVIEVDLKEEIEINDSLNNKNLQGEYDAELIAALKDEYDVDIANALNFDKAELTEKFRIQLDDFRDVPEVNQQIEDALNELDDADAEEKKQREAQKAIMANRQQSQDVKNARESGEYTANSDNRDYDLQIIFNTNKEKQEFLQLLDIKEDTKCILFEQFKNLLNSEQ